MSFSTNVGQNWPALVAVVAFFAAGLGYLRWAKSQSAVNTVKLLNDEINAQALTIARLEGEIKENRAVINAQNEKLTLVTDLLRGIPAWAQLHASVAKLERNADRIDLLIEAYPTDWMHQQMRHFADTAAIAAAIKEGKDAPTP